MTDEDEKRITADRATIERHGGAEAFALKLGFPLPQGYFRVAKWMQRGIPARVKLEHPRLFKARRK